MSITFDELREANVARLPLFKNRHGQPAHTTQDGSDWTPAQWLQALLGELGEFARARLDYELGAITKEQYEVMAAKELADVQTYLDILALRALDVTRTVHCVADPAELLMAVVASLGEYANERKKFERGDLGISDFQERSGQMLRSAHMATCRLLSPDLTRERAGGQAVVEAHPDGVDLGQATADKFNEVSRRVGAPVWITGRGVVVEELTNA